MTNLYCPLPRLLIFLLLSLLLSNCNKPTVERNYTVAFKSNGGSDIKTDTVREGQKVNKPSDPTRVGYTFSGWYADKDFQQAFDFANTPITINITLYAKWDQNQTTVIVTFSSEGGSAVPSQNVDKGQKAKKPPAPVRTGYIFVNWYADRSFQQAFDFNNIITSDTTLYAKWDQNQSTVIVTFSSEGGSAVPSQSVDKGQKVNKPPAPVRTGYVFVDWYADKSFQQAFDFNHIITSNTTLYAKWDQNQSTVMVIFSSEGGSAVPSQSVEKWQKANKPSDPVRMGYTFAGWYLSNGFQQAFDFANIPILINIRLYAKWNQNQNTFLVTFSSEGGSALFPRSVVSGQKVNKPSDPVRTGHTFAGWYVSNGFQQAFNFANTAIMVNITLYAKWDQTTFLVAFSSEGGSAVPSQSVNKGQKATKPPNPVRTGYTFAGWYVSNGFQQAFDFANIPILINITLYAKWERIMSTVTFSSGDGRASLSQRVVLGEKAAKPADPIRTDYTFAGWYADSGFQQAFNFANIAITSNITLYAKWERTMYVVTFSSGDGRASLSQRVASGDKATKPSDPPKRADYAFAGWYADSGFKQAFDFANIAIKGNITLYAKWERIMYTVTFSSNDGSAVSPQNIDSAQKAIKPSNPIRPGYAFKGWYLSDDFQQAFNFANTAITTNITLYAKWKKFPTYTVTFESNGDTALPPQHIDSTLRAIIPTDPTRTGYAFVGWYADKSLQQAFDFDNTFIIAHTTLYAKWNQNQNTFLVTFSSGGGSAVPSQSVDKGQKATKPSDPTRTGYTFAGWYSDSGFQQAFNFANTGIMVNITLYAKWDAP